MNAAAAPRRPKAHMYRTPGCCGMLDDVMYERLGLDLVDTPIPDEIFNQGTMVIAISSLVGTNIVNLLTYRNFPEETVGQVFDALTGPATTGFGAAVFGHAISDVVCSKLRVRPSIAKYISAGVQIVAGTAASIFYIRYGIGGPNPHP